MSDLPRSQAAQIRATLATQIDSGLLPLGAKLPSERELSDLFSTTRITIKDALLALEAEGRIYREDRRGWFVSPPRLIYNPQYRSHFHEMVTRQQRQVETRVLSAATVLATPALSQELNLGAMAQLYRIQRTRSIDGRVVLYVEHHLKPEFFPGILDKDLSQSLTLIYEREYDIHYGRSRFDIYPSAARGDVAQALTLAEGSPILLVFRINYDQHGQIIDCDHEYWRHDAILITVDSQTAAGD
ncbi:MAG: UTRA domain-containing protein [Paludibacterium sp.]|uniref:UTRA domain-containing protein n=1 Tax=Paludibacterium sp. TaxID=1917523 RepID=UPI0025E3D1D9|nr:UTRA domain-containing protein [Paludibacterium sp.]MBV8049227.1 UTRA domain-containing protein [Paludibacterium sp.]MBV8646608.1 UTRA domain-containing protein [Paludibacterium sp.]